MTIVTQQYAYCTLITQASYLAGVLVLAHTLRKHDSPYPLIVLYTDTLSSSALRVLKLEAVQSNLILHPVPHLLPKGPVSLIAARFADTWTKLRVFQLYELSASLPLDGDDNDNDNDVGSAQSGSQDQFDRICYLDADMAIFRNPDHIFDTPLPSSDWIAANHACVCNLDNDVWAPSDWTVENCAYTPLKRSDPPTEVTPSSRPTHHLLNSGMFLFSPSDELWQRMLGFFNHTAPLETYLFPDQDFLAAFFENRWKSVGWEFNAIKTMKYWHPSLWADEQVVVLHYIVDKPWTKRVGQDGVAGYLGKDGETHTLWWAEWEEWAAKRSEEVVRDVPVASHPGASTGDSAGGLLDAIGSAVQALASNRVTEALGLGSGSKKQEEEEASIDKVNVVVK